MLHTARSVLRRLGAPLLAALVGAVLLALPRLALASELDLELPLLDPSQRQLLFMGLGVCVIGMMFGLAMFNQVQAMPAHQSMLDVSDIIYETCKTYLLQAGPAADRARGLHRARASSTTSASSSTWTSAGWPRSSLFSIVGILGSYGVAWFGIRMNTLRQQPHGVRLAQGQAAAGLRDSAPGRHEHRRAADLRRADHDARDPAVRRARERRRLLPRLRDRRVARRLGAAYRRRHLHQDRRHRLRPDEGRVQDQGGRSAQPGRDRRLHRRQRRRLGRPDRRRLRDLRRHRRRADLVHRAGGDARAQGHAPGVDLRHAHPDDPAPRSAPTW